MLLILDFGSGNTCRNDYHEMRQMIDALADVDSRRQCTVKWQLWTHGTEPQCVKLNWALFKRAFIYAESRGFRTTASVFDVEALRYLLTFDVPFIKLANRPYLRHLAKYVPRGLSIVYSVSSNTDSLDALDTLGLDIIWRDESMLCVSEYPAEFNEYDAILEKHPELSTGISDHTTGLDLWRKYKPKVYEKHFALPTSTGPDAGPWCISGKELGEILDG